MPTACRDRRSDYVELHCHSAFSFGDGASTPQELAQKAAELGHEALALTDHDGLWGAMELSQACKSVGVRPIVGSEITVTPTADITPPAASPSATLPSGSGANGAAGRTRSYRDFVPSSDQQSSGTFHLTLLVENQAGWRNLCRLITEAHRDTRPVPGREPLPPALPLASLERRTEGLICLSGCAREGGLAGRFERAGGRPRASDAAAAEALGKRLISAFGHDRFRIELQRPLWRSDRARNRWLAQLGERLGVRCVATGDVHMHDPSRAPLQDTLVAVRLGGGLEETEPERRGNGSAHLATSAAIAARFADHPDAVAESARLAERLEFDLDRDLGYRYPGSEDPGADRALAEICRTRLEHRYAGGA